MHAQSTVIRGDALRSAKTARRRVSPALFLWLVTAAVTFLLGELALLPAGIVLTVVAGLGIAQSIAIFLTHGGTHHVTAPGVFAIGTGLFAFFPGVYFAHTGVFESGLPLLEGVTVVYVSQLLMYYTSWKSREPARTVLAADLQTVARSPLLWSFWMGIALMVAGHLGNIYLGLGSSTLAGAASFVGVVMITLAVLFSGKRMTLVNLLVAAGAFGIYVTSMYSGGGRLVVGVLAVALAILVGERARGRWIKPAALIAMPVGLILLARDRSAAVAVAGRQETGLESVLDPLETFAQLLLMSDMGRLDYALGSTFWAAAVVLVPRAIWPEKPIGLGAELTEIFRPELTFLGHTESLLLQGEFLYNFGVLGFVCAIPVVAWFVGWLDRKLAQSEAGPMRSRRDVLFRVATVLAAAGILDLVWTGTSTYTGRTWQRLLILAAIFVLFAWENSPSMPLGPSNPRRRGRSLVRRHP